MATTFRCKLITPEAQVFDDAAKAVVFPAHDGLMGVLPGRAAMVVQLGTGEFRVDFADTATTKGGSRSFFLDDGFAQMLDNQLTILAANAVPAESLSESAALAEVNELAARRTDGLDAAEADRLAKSRQRAAAKLRAAREYRAKGAI